MFGRLKATIPEMSDKKSSTDTIRPFKTNKTNILSYGAFFLIFVSGMALRWRFTSVTPDVVYAPVIKSKKYSTEPDEPLQNDVLHFVMCYISEEGCIPDGTPGQD